MEVFLSDTRPDYFRVLGIPLREGRDFSERDTQSSTPVAIVSEDFARHAWGDSSALGRRVSLNGAKGPYLTVVGVARSALTMGMSRQRPVLYRALGQTLLSRFAGWRVGVITNEASLAEATGLPFAPPGPLVTHGGLRVTLFPTGALTAPA